MARACLSGVLSGEPFRLDSLPYLRILERAGMACQGQTL
jgi:hypothetical protein